MLLSGVGVVDIIIQGVPLAPLVERFGERGVQAALDGVMSSTVGADEQGWLAGGMSSLGSAVQMTAAARRLAIRDQPRRSLP